MAPKGHPLPDRLPTYVEATEPLESWWKPRDGYTLSWSTNSHPHLAYIPAVRRPRGCIFQRIAYGYRDAPVRRSGNVWVLDPLTKHSCQRLEGALWGIWQRITPKKGVLLPLDFQADYGVPFQYDYNFSTPDEKFARKRALTIRDAFYVLAALCSLMVSQYPLHANRWISGPEPTWTDLLLLKNVHPDWVEELRQSFVADFTLPRVGSLVDVRTCQWRNLIPGMLAAGVPLWLYWGTVDNLTTVDNAFTNRYRPSLVEIRLALTKHDGPSYPMSSDPSSCEPNEEVSVSNAIKPEPGSRQRPGETWQQFLARDAVYSAKRLQEESPDDKLARLNRERTPVAPGRRGARVWHWQPVADGIRIRTLIPRRFAQNVWGSYNAKQAIFNSLRNEWDVCTEFDPDPTDTDSDDDDWNWRPGDPNIDRPRSPEQSSWPEDILDNVDPEEDYQKYPCPSLSDIAAYRYGLDIYDASFSDIAVSNDDWVKVTSIMCEFSNREEHGDGSFSAPLPRGAIVSFVMSVLNGQTEPLSSGPDLASPHTSLSIRLLKSMYTVCVKGVHQMAYDFALEDPVSALQCVSAMSAIPGNVTLDDVVTYVVHLGIPCRTLTASRAMPNLPKPMNVYLPTIGLGYRPAGYQAGPADYARYVSVRNAFLREPRARAALLKGGIVWRLARGVLGVYDTTSGPSEDAMKCGFVLEDEQRGILIDDDLTQEEMDLICGVYHVVNSKAESLCLNIEIDIWL
ncbi:MAG TPA: hypothetical protein VGO47_12935 [Chlamydiales bacterium]|nr:hypothetical protein [Chlamydiales bacterium]